LSQLELQMKVVIEKTIDDLEMGVLEDGTSYLSARGLAKLCGVVPSAVITQGLNWGKGERNGKLAKMLVNAGITRAQLHHPTGKSAHAYTEEICMIFLEYYAFEAQENLTALRNYRLLARAGLRAFIYHALGYDPRNVVPDRWRKFHDRLMLNPLPAGYFSVFREMADLVLTAAQNGLMLDEHTIPDISIGRAWSTQWKDGGLETKYGPRIKHPHVYPEYFPQAQAGDEIEAWIYPLGALGDFRLWIQQTYLPSKFPKYLETKVKQGMLPPSTAELILNALEPKKLPS